MQTSASGRVIYTIAVSEGDVFYRLPGDTAWSAPTNDTGEDPPLVYSGLVRSFSLNQKQYFVDGTNYVYFDPILDKILPWVVTYGELPYDDEDNAARLCCAWRGRPVLSGLLLDPQNIFWGAVGTALDYEYSGQYVDGVLTTTPTQAVAGNLAPFGLIGDVVTSVCPYSDDLLLIFCDHHIHMMRGDPADGGKVDLISNILGGAFGVCWCVDPNGVVYFFSTKTGLYKMPPGNSPQKISDPIDSLTVNVDTGENEVCLVYDDLYQAIHVFVTPSDAPVDDTVHLTYELRTNAWFTFGFANKNHNPLCACTIDGNLSTDRVVAIGSFDGYVRIIDPTATRDDGYDIESEVVIGPFLTKDMDDIMIDELQAYLAETSGDVTWEIFVGKTPEAALAAAAVQSGTFSAGRSLNRQLRWAGHAIYLKLSSTNQWAMEQLRAKIYSLGDVRRRN